MNYVHLLLMFGGAYSPGDSPFEIHRTLLPSAENWGQIENILTPICNNELDHDKVYSTFFEVALLGGNVAPHVIDYLREEANNIGSKAIDGVFQSDALKPYNKDYLFNTVIPFTACLTLQVPKVFPLGIPVLSRGGRTRISLSKAHAAILLSGGFWGAIVKNGDLKMHVYNKETRQYATPQSKESYDENMKNLYEAAEFSMKSAHMNPFNFFEDFIDDTMKYQAFLAYLCTMTEKLSPNYPFDLEQMQIVTNHELLSKGTYGGRQVSSPYERIDFVLNNPAIKYGDINWSTSDKPLKPIKTNKQRVEDAKDSTHVMFVDGFIGNFLFYGGESKEDIYLITHPETILSMLFTSQLASQDSVTIYGAELYSMHKGSGDAITFEGCAVNCWNKACKRDLKKDLDSQITDGNRVGLDDTGRRRVSVMFSNFLSVYNGRIKSRVEHASGAVLDTMYAGLVGLPYPTQEQLSVSSGSPGSHKVNIREKALLQWLAASQAGRTLLYSPYGESYTGNIEELSKMLVKKYKTVGNLFRSYVTYLQGHPDAFNVDVAKELLHTK